MLLLRSFNWIDQSELHVIYHDPSESIVDVIITLRVTAFTDFSLVLKLRWRQIAKS